MNIFDKNPCGAISSLEEFQDLLNEAKTENVTLYAVCGYYPSISEITLTKNTFLEQDDIALWAKNSKSQSGDYYFALEAYNIRNTYNINFMFTSKISAEHYVEFCKTDPQILTIREIHDEECNRMDDFFDSMCDDYYDDDY